MCDVPSIAFVVVVVVENLLNAFLVLSPDILISVIPSDYCYDEAFHISHSLNFHTQILIC
jgi:hypothetical protein